MVKKPIIAPDGDDTPAPWETTPAPVESKADDGMDADPHDTRPPAPAPAPDVSPSWAADDAPEVPEVDPRFRREQLARQRDRTTPPGEGARLTYQGPATQNLLQRLEFSASTIDGDNSAVYEDIFARILQSDSAESIFADDDPLDAEELMGISLQVRDISVVKSDHTDGLQWYVAMKARRLDINEDVVVTCGAAKVVAQLMQAKSLQLFPVTVKFVKKERATRAGRHPLAMVLVK